MPEDVFCRLMDRYDWKPMKGCPGRFVLVGGVSPFSIEQLLGWPADVREERFAGVPDPVAYCFFKGGGLISYRKAEGFLHTLCDEGGMERKMGRLRGEET